MKLKNKIKKINFKNCLNKLKDYIDRHKLFNIYILLSLSATILIRLFTINNNSWKIFDYRPLITDLGIIIIIGSFVHFIKNNNKKYLYLQIILSIFSLLCIINAIYYAFFSSFASITELNTIGQVKTVSGAFLERLKFSQIIYLIFPIIFHLYYRNLKNNKLFDLNKKTSKNTFKKTIITGIILVLLSFLTAKQKDYSRLYKQWNRTYLVDRFGIIMYQSSDFVTSFTSKLTTVFGFENALTKMNEYYNQEKKYTGNNQYTDMFKNYNIIFIHMESIQNFLVPLKYNNQYVLPTVNKLINEGMYFNNFYPEISTGTSSDTEFTLLTSLLPTRIGVVFSKYYNRDYVTIPKLLNNKGYYTFSMHGNDFTMWNRHRAHPSLGYKNFYFKTEYKINENECFNLGIKDEYFFKQSIPYLEKIEKENKNYMGTIITLSNHSPYVYLDEYEPFSLKEETLVLNNETNKYEKKHIDYLTGTTIGNYIISSHSADVALGKFINDIEKSKYFNNTIFVLYGDHDPRLAKSEYNYFYNYSMELGRLLNKHDENYYDYNDFQHHINKKTPLIIWSKNKNVQKLIKGTYDYPMGMIDVMPTIGNMIGISNKYALGHDIFNIKNENIIPFPNGNYLTKEFYYSANKNKIYTIKENVIINDNIINKGIEYTDKHIEISNDIIIHDLIKYREEYKKKKLL